VSNSSRSFGSRRFQKGFTLIEALIAIGILIILIGIVAVSLTRGLQTKHTQSVFIELQQNLRYAMQQITQDLRSTAKLAVWNSPSSGCDDPGDICSSRDRLGLLVSRDYHTAVAEPPGGKFSNSANTGVCDASGFEKDDLVLIANGEENTLVTVTDRQLKRDPSRPCIPPSAPGSSGPANRDIIKHSKEHISGTWQPNSYAFKVRLVSYELRPDPTDPSRHILYRHTGQDASPGPFSGIVAFDIDTLRISYGIPLNPGAKNSSIQQLRFYDSLSDAASTLGSKYTDNPNSTSGIYVGKVVRAVRVYLAGTTSKPLTKGGNKPGHYEITETVDLRLN